MKPLLETLPEILSSSWKIGLYKGNSPTELQPFGDDPILSGGNVDDALADFVADPFLVYFNDELYVFFEYLDAFHDCGKIAVAQQGDDGSWSYLGTVLSEDFHLSYPFVFRYEDDFFLVPESKGDQSIRLYRCEDFPRKWKMKTKLLEGQPFVDPTLFRHNNIWWLFTTVGDSLRLYFSDNFLGNNWTEHPDSPVRTGPDARMAGSITVSEGSRYMFSQVSRPFSGSRLDGYLIRKLSREKYEERPLSPDEIPHPGEASWNRQRLHHVGCLLESSGQCLAAVDGQSKKFEWRIHVIFWRIFHILRRKFFGFLN